MASPGRIAYYSYGAAAGATGGGFTNFTVDASDKGIAWTFQPYSTDAITHLGFRYGARTGTPPTYSIRLEGLDGSGLPDNTDSGGGSATAVTFTPPADTTINGLWQWKTLTNAYTPTRGQFLASVIRYSSGTINSSNCSSFTQHATSNSYVPASTFPYSLSMTTSTWTKAAQACFGWRTASGRFGFIIQSNYSTLTANTATHRSGMYFTLPSSIYSSVKVVGLRLRGTPGAAAGSCKAGIWDTSWNVIQDVTVDSDHLSGAPGSSSPAEIMFDESSLTALTGGTKYYCGLEVVSGAVGVYGHTLAETGDASAYPDGTNRGLVTYNGTTTTESGLTIPQVELFMDDIVGAGGGGGGRASIIGG